MKCQVRLELTDSTEVLQAEFFHILADRAWGEAELLGLTEEDKESDEVEWS